METAPEAERERRGERFWWGFWGTCGETAEKRESEGQGEVGFFFFLIRTGNLFFFWLEQNKDGEVGLLSRQTLQHVNVFPLKKTC
jgi:hypothetical protein